MPTLNITEYSELLVLSGGRVGQMPVEPALMSQDVPISKSSTQSMAFDPRTKFVRLQTDAACRVRFGTDPKATVMDCRMFVGSTEFYGVSEHCKIAVIAEKYS